MPILQPFQALYYNRNACGDRSRVIAPPYDVISADYLADLYERSPYNVVRLILNRDPDRYESAARELRRWRDNEVLIRDPAPCFYYYVQDFRLRDGSTHTRGGLMAAVRLADFREGIILPHERTFASAREDRLKLLRACRVNLSPIFGMYADRADALEPVRRAAETEVPWIDVTDDRAERHRLWRVHRPDDIRHVIAGLRDATVFVADGHHRYETALAYRDECFAAGENDPHGPHCYVLMYLASMDDPGLVILPTHRVFARLPLSNDALLARLNELYASEALPNDGAGRGELSARLAGEDAPGSLGLCLAGKPDLLFLRLRDRAVIDRVLGRVDATVRTLDVGVLDGLLLRATLGIDCATAAQEGWLSYTHSDDEAIEAVGSGQAVASFLVRAPTIGQVRDACLAGQVMPEKSTYFYPKLLSGLIFRELDV